MSLDQRKEKAHIEKFAVRRDKYNAFEKTDAELKGFLNELRPQTLEYLGARFIRTIGSHFNSLTHLNLGDLNLDIIAELSSLRTPSALRVLTLKDIQRIAMWH